MNPEWELSEALTSDGDGVRAVCALPGGPEAPAPGLRLLTGTQSGGLVLYHLLADPDPRNNGSRLASCEVLPPHPHAVTALLAVDALGAYATACKDGVVRLFDAATHRPRAELSGHEKPVTSLALATTAAAPSGGGTAGLFLVSGSWDGTAKVWSLADHALLATLPNHENSVCVAALAGGDGELGIATGSAGVAQNHAIIGHAVRIWSVQTHTGEVRLRHTVSGDHDGPVRGLCWAPGAQLASCSNDGTVKLRDAATGRATGTLSFVVPGPQQQQQQQQQPPILLSVAAVGDDSLAAAAEDGLVVVWDLSGAEPQLLDHGATVWSVAALPNGDLATACQDGQVRLFTRSADRAAPAAVRQEFAEQVRAKRQGAASGPSAEEIARLPHWSDNLRVRGTGEGQVQLFQRDGIAIAAQWSAASSTWIEVGQVMGSAGGGSDNVIDGVTYDHVFPIEVDSPSHPGGVANLRLGYNNGENPFIAAQRFIDAHVLPQYHLAQIADYITQRSGHGGVTLGGTGGGRSASIPAAVTGVPIAAYVHLPMKSYKTFELSDKQASTTMEKMKTKIDEFGKLSGDQMATLSTLMSVLQGTSRYHSTQISDTELELVTHMLETFPASEAFPALDLARMAALHPDAASRPRSAYWHRVMQISFRLCQTAEAEKLEGPAAMAIPMLSLRLFANAFKGGPGSLDAAVSNLEPILQCCTSYVKTSNKNVRLSVATLIANICYYLYLASQDGSPNFPPEVLHVINEILSNYKLYESEAIFRTLVGLGTLVMGVPQAKEASRSLFLLAKVQPAASPHGDDAKNAAREVYAVLQ